MNAHDDDDNDDRFPPTTFIRITNTLIHASFTHPPRYRFSRFMVFVFGSFCDFSPPTLLAFKDLSTIQSYIQPGHTEIDGGELARYTTPYLNSYGLVGPFTPSPHPSLPPL